MQIKDENEIQVEYWRSDKKLNNLSFSIQNIYIY